MPQSRPEPGKRTRPTGNRSFSLIALAGIQEDISISSDFLPSVNHAECARRSFTRRELSILSPDLSHTIAMRQPENIKEHKCGQFESWILRHRLGLSGTIGENGSLPFPGDHHQEIAKQDRWREQGLENFPVSLPLNQVFFFTKCNAGI